MTSWLWSLFRRKNRAHVVEKNIDFEAGPDMDLDEAKRRVEEIKHDAERRIAYLRLERGVMTDGRTDKS